MTCKALFLFGVGITQLIIDSDWGSQTVIWQPTAVIVIDNLEDGIYCDGTEDFWEQIQHYSELF